MRAACGSLLETAAWRISFLSPTVTAMAVTGYDTVSTRAHLMIVYSSMMSSSVTKSAWTMLCVVPVSSRILHG